MRSMARVMLAVLAVLATGAGLLLAFSSEARSLALVQLAPARARDAHFVKLARPGGPTVYLLGTIHSRHLETEAYSLLHIQAAIERLRPDLLLVESRPAELARGNWADGPIEMPFASLTARALGLRVEGMDWWGQEHLGLRRSNAEREVRMAANILERLPERGRVLVLTGFSHVVELLPRLEAAGYARVGFPRAEKRALFDTAGMELSFPPGMADAIKARIGEAEAELRAKGEEPRASRYLADRRRLLELIARMGERNPSEGGTYP